MISFKSFIWCSFLLVGPRQLVKHITCFSGLNCVPPKKMYKMRSSMWLFEDKALKEVIKVKWDHQEEIKSNMTMWAEKEESSKAWAERKVLTRTAKRAFPGGPVVKTPHSQCRRAWFRSLVMELRSHPPCSVAKRKKECGEQEKVAIYKPGKKASPETTSASTLTFDFQPPELCENKLLLLKTPILWSSVTAAWAD